MEISKQSTILSWPFFTHIFNRVNVSEICHTASVERQIKMIKYKYMSVTMYLCNIINTLLVCHYYFGSYKQYSIYTETLTAADLCL